MRFTRKDRDAFPREWGGIVVEVGGRFQAFAFTPGFWNKCPVFRDRGKPTLRNRLRAEGLLPWPKGKPLTVVIVPTVEGKPPKFELERVEGNRFRLSRADAV